MAADLDIKLRRDVAGEGEGAGEALEAVGREP